MSESRWYLDSSAQIEVLSLPRQADRTGEQKWYIGESARLSQMCLFVLFCFVLFCFVLFCFVLFCFVLFCFVLFCFVFFCDSWATRLVTGPLSHVG